MIFSSQLGKLDGRHTERSLQTIANHLRRMQEELEYRLANLDSSNINEINMDQTKVFTKGKDINNIIIEQDKKMSQFQQTVDGFSQKLADYEEGYSEWTQTVEEFRSTVSDYETKISAWSQTVDGFTQQVADYEKGYSSLVQTVEGFTQQVADFETGYSSWEQTVEGFQWTVQKFEQQLGASLTLDESGLIVRNSDGSVVLIGGGQIDANTVCAKYLYGTRVYLTDSNQNIIGQLTITNTSTGDGLEINTYAGQGGIKINASGNVSIVPGGSAYYVGIGHGGKYVSCQTDLQPSSAHYTCGTSSYPWDTVYASSGEISTSDREKKNSIDYDMTAYESLFDGLKPCSFKLNDGTSDRRHIALVAQDVEATLAAVGLSTQDFAGFVKSPKKDENENVIAGEYDYFLRYGEFIGLCIAEIQKLKARVTELEKGGMHRAVH